MPWWCAVIRGWARPDEPEHRVSTVDGCPDDVGIAVAADDDIGLLAHVFAQACGVAGDDTQFSVADEVGEQLRTDPAGRSSDDDHGIFLSGLIIHRVRRGPVGTEAAARGLRLRGGQQLVTAGQW